MLEALVFAVHYHCLRRNDLYLRHKQEFRDIDNPLDYLGTQILYVCADCPNCTDDSMVT